MTTSATVQKLTTYPIKGLSGQSLESLTLQTGRGFPMDRAFAFARYNSGMDPANPRLMPKSKFHVLARDAALAKLDTEFDADSKHLTIRHGETTLVYDLSSGAGVNEASTYLASIVGLSPEQRPDFITGGDLRFTDVCMSSPQMMNAVSVINLASVRAFGEAIGRQVDPERFRGNILIDGWAPFSEFDMLDQEISLGGARLKILKRTARCPATQVNLQTAQRDMDVPELLHETYGHRDMGIYAEVISDGDVTLGDAVS